MKVIRATETTTLKNDLKNVFERETLNPNIEKYLNKTIGYKLLYVIYGFSTTVIANLICVANIGPRVRT